MFLIKSNKINLGIQPQISRIVTDFEMYTLSWIGRKANLTSWLKNSDIESEVRRCVFPRSQPQIAFGRKSWAVAGVHG